MDWVHIVILTVIILGVCFAIYAQKAGRRRPYDPSDLRTLENQNVCKPPRPWADDPIAKAIEWAEGAEGGGGVGHKLRHVGSNRLEFQPHHPRSWYIVTLLMGVGAATLVYFGSGAIGQIILALLCFMGLSAVGWLFFRFSMTPVVFDKSSGIFWVGRKQPVQVFGNPPSKSFGRIDDIYALQLILTYISTRSGDDTSSLGHTYPRYQINLVMKNGTRINVVNYRSSDDSLKKNANALSMFLEKPLWDNC